jgi:hypothetical protein
MTHFCESLPSVTGGFAAGPPNAVSMTGRLFSLRTSALCELCVVRSGVPIALPTSRSCHGDLTSVLVLRR